jgi:[ribosomal protein S5]-alanine N-acetyltransferase
MEIRVDAGILLRPWRLEDAPAIAEACRDPAIPRWIPWVPEPYTDADAEDYVRGCLEASEERRPFAIASESDGRLLGSIELRINPRLVSGHIGYWVVADARGSGVATSALRALSRWALEELELGRLELVTDPDNVASRRVAEKAGFREEGILRSHMPHRDGRRRDSVLYGLLPREL